MDEYQIDEQAELRKRLSPDKVLELEKRHSLAVKLEMAGMLLVAGLGLLVLLFQSLLKLQPILIWIILLIGLSFFTAGMILNKKYNNQLRSIAEEKGEIDNWL